MLAAALTPPFAVAAALLVVAGVAKLRSRRLTEAALGSVEIAAGAGALAAPGRVTAGLVAVLYAAFSVHVARLLVAGDQAPCGCLGAESSSASRAHVALNAAALAVAAAAAAQPPHGPAWLLHVGAGAAVALVLGAAAATYAAYLVLAALPGAWRAYEADPHG